MRHREILATLMLVSSLGWGASSAWVEVKGGSWQPSETQLGETEAALRRQVPPASRNRGRIPGWKAYTFQYQGQRTLLGHRYIHINAFCDSRGSFPDISSQWVQVVDEGACYFSATFDVDEHRLYDLEVNGMA